MFVTWKPQQLTLVSNVTNTSMFYVELRVRRGCYVRIARLIPTEFVIVQGPWTVNQELGTPAIGQTVAISTFDRGKGDSYLEKSRITNRNTTYKQFGKYTCD